VAYKHATRAALLTFIRGDTEPRHIRRIERYMQMFHGTKPSATREQLRRLVKAGVLERLDGQWYRCLPED
jgi:hypothetical protein